MYKKMARYSAVNHNIEGGCNILLPSVCQPFSVIARLPRRKRYEEEEYTHEEYP